MNIWDKEKECKNYITKIRNSGWNNYFVIVGGNIDYDSCCIGIGLFKNMDDYDLYLELDLHTNDYD